MKIHIRRVLFSAIFLALGGGYLWYSSARSFVDSERRKTVLGSNNLSPLSPGNKAGGVVTKKASPSAGFLSIKNSILATLTSGNSGKWKKALPELLHPRHERSEVVAFLRELLKYNDPYVQATAAEYLFQLGLSDGRDVLFSIIDPGNDAPSSSIKLYSAIILDRYGVFIPYVYLESLYFKTRGVSLVKIMAMQRQQNAAPLIRKLREAGESGGSYYYLAELGEFNSNDVNNAHGIYEQAVNVEDKVSSAWFIYKSGGGEPYLNYIMDIAKAAAFSGSPRFSDASASNWFAYEVIASYKSPVAVKLLREVAEAAPAEAASIALASLFYIQKDYAYVDNVVTSYAKGAANKKIDSKLVWRIAERRGVESIAQAVRLFNMEAYKIYFEQWGDRPSENWISSYITYIPLAAKK